MLFDLPSALIHFLLSTLPFNSNTGQQSEVVPESRGLAFRLRHAHATHNDSRIVFTDAPATLSLSSDAGLYYPGLRTKPLTIYKPSSMQDFQVARRRRSAVGLSWTSASTPSPDTSDRETLLLLAKMTSNAYTNPNATDWYPLDRFPDNNTLPFGWEPDADGFRGHVFVSEDNSTVVVSVKGTSAGWMVGGGGPTVAKDKLNDNLLFSCCCAKVGPTWSPVCGCHQGGYKCGQTCLERSLADDSLFYSVGINLYNNVTYMYPNANIWMIGHSLGGSLASLIGNTFGAPVVTFEAPPEKLAATRLHLPTPPSVQHITHVFHTADPIAMGTCNGVRSLCAIGGYAMESKCHMGTIVKYDTITDLGWSADSRTHGILVIIERLLGTDWWREKHGDASEGETSDGRAKDREVPAPTLDEDCVDCFDWEFVEDFGTGVGCH